MNKDTLFSVEKWIAEKKVRQVTASQEEQKILFAKEEPVIPKKEKPVPTKKEEVVERRDVSDLKREIIHGNCLEVLKSFPDNTFTAIVTDPPYGLSKQPDMKEVLRHWLDGDDYEHTSNGFMGKSWDSFVPGPKIWKEIMRVLKPGGHILSFSGTRTYDMAVLAMRMAGSEVRDKIDYIYEQQEPLDWIHGQGFPKSLNIGKALDKSAGAEREIVGTVDVGPDMRGGNFKASEGRKVSDITIPATDEAKKWEGYGTALKPAHEPIAVFGKDSEPLNPDVPFKYESKASTKERNLGCDNLYWMVGEEGVCLISKDAYDILKSENETRKDEAGFVPHKLMEGNIHPTVKPVELMRYLVKMVKMPEGNLILDPFCGSGTTLVACELEGCGYVGIDMDGNSVITAKARTEYVKNGGRGFKS